jgi:hypothetical protein
VAGLGFVDSLRGKNAERVDGGLFHLKKSPNVFCFSPVRLKSAAHFRSLIIITVFAAFFKSFNKKNRGF